MARDRIFQFASIDKSPLVEINGEIIVDFTAIPISVPNSEEKGVRIIDRKLAGKPHLIAKILCGSHDYIDLLFSYNGYSNPLTVKGGDLLVVPPNETLLKGMRSVSNINNSIKELSKRAVETTISRLSFLKKEITETKTPNMNEEGTQFIKVGRSVFLGKRSVSTDDAIETTKEILKLKINQNDRKL